MVEDLLAVTVDCTREQYVHVDDRFGNFARETGPAARRRAQILQPHLCRHTILFQEQLRLEELYGPAESSKKDDLTDPKFRSRLLQKAKVVGQAEAIHGLR